MNNKLLKRVGIGIGAFTLAYLFISNLFVPDAIVARVKRGTTIEAVTGTVTVEPEINTSIFSPAVGFMIKSHLKEGIPVEEGELLATIDPGNLPFQLNDAKLQLEAKKQSLENGSPLRFQIKSLQDDIERLKPLVAEGFESQVNVDVKTNRIKELEGQIQQAEDALKNQADILENKIKELEDELERHHVRAPFDGLITKIHAFTGDLLRHGAEIASINSNAQRINAEVNQDDISAIKAGAKADIRFFAYGNTLFDAKVRQIIPDADPKTQRFTVYLDLLTPPEDLLPGTTGEVTFYGETKANTLKIPRRGLMGNNILVINNGRVNVRKIETGIVTYSEAEILDGVEEGDLVIIEDVDLFREGEKVNVAEILGEKNS